jgi:hypothetical protein
MSHYRIFHSHFYLFVATWTSNGWPIVYCFTSRARIFHCHGDVTIAGEGLLSLGLCSALRAFEQGRVFIVPHLLCHGTSVFCGLIRLTRVSSEPPPHQSPLTTHKGMWRTYSNLDLHGVTAVTFLYTVIRLTQESFTGCRSLVVVLSLSKR